MPGPGPMMMKPPAFCLGKLKTGDKVREKKSGIVFLIAGHEHENWKGITTLITDCVIKNASYDAREPDSTNKFIREFGNPDYPLSNIHQWLTADREDWYHPSHFKDMPPEGEYIERTPEFYYHSPNYPEMNILRGPFDYRNEPGFLTRFSKRFVQAMRPVRIPVAVTKENGLIEKGELYTAVFLPSMREVGYNEYDPFELGSRFELFENPIYRICGPDPRAINMPENYKYKDVLWWFMTRNSIPENPGYIFKITPGYRGGVFASRQAMLHRCNVASGVRPMINISSMYPVSERPGEDGVYDLIDPMPGMLGPSHNMLAIPGNLTQTLSVNGKVDDKLVPGCVCTNLTCIRHGLCEACRYYHSSGYGSIHLFEPTCEGDHFKMNPAIVEMCHDDLGRAVMCFNDAAAL